MARETPCAPSDPRSPWVTLEQAAYLMGVEPEEVKEYIDRGLLLASKASLFGEGPIMIHQTEMDRFRHPWKHIWRLDDRINAQQRLVETLKEKINGGGDVPSRLNDLERRMIGAEYDIEGLGVSYRALPLHGETGVVSRVDLAHSKVDELNAVLLKAESTIAAQAKTINKLQKDLKKLQKDLKKLVDGHKIHRG